MRRITAVSVIMSVYNPDRNQLVQAIRSMIGQTFWDWELILYNDGSDPEYDEIISDAAAMDERIRYIYQKENHGLAYGLNECLAAARGKYAARMDGDDISHPQRLGRKCMIFWKLIRSISGWDPIQRLLMIKGDGAAGKCRKSRKRKIF